MRQYFRAYPAISSRQQGADRLVYTEKDFRRVLWQAVDPDFEGERPSTIRLAADIYLTRPIELGAYQYNVTIDGSGRFSISEGASFQGSYLFKLPDGSLSDIEFTGVAFELNQASAIFSGSALSAVSDFALSQCSVDSTSFASVFDGPAIVTSAIVDFDNDPVNIGVGGLVDYTGIVSLQSSFGQFKNSQPGFVRRDDRVGCKTVTPRVSIDINGASAFEPEYILLTGSDPTITPYQASVSDRTFFRVTIANGAPFGATGEIQIAPGVNGQLLVLYFTNTASNVRLADNSTVNVDKNHSSKLPLARETVSFIYIDSKWREIARSENV